jgi:hypothetical protein
VVASLCGMASQVSHLAAPRNGIVPENSLPNSHDGRRGKGALAGRERLAKRLERPNPCGGGRLCEIGLFQSSFIASASTSSLHLPARSAVPVKAIGFWPGSKPKSGGPLSTLERPFEIGPVNERKA